MARVFLVAVLLIVLAGCGGSSSSSPPDPSPPLNHNPNILEWGVVGVPDVPTLDPALASDATSFSVASLIYGGLVRLDASLHVKPDGAASWTISRAGTVYTFHLRPNLRFDDGTPVSAQAFVDALDRALGPQAAAGAAPLYLNLIAQRRTVQNGQTVTLPAITAPDPSTVRIRLVHPGAHFLAELAFPVSFVADPSVMQTYGTSWTEHAAGFGPYAVAEWQHGRFLRLVRNPYWYGGKPALKGITLHFYQTDNALTAYRNGTLDLISGVEPGADLPSSPIGIRRVRGLALDYLAFNTTRLPFERINARRAFAAVWRNTLVSAAMGKTAFPVQGFLPSDFGLQIAPWRPTAAPKTYLLRARFPRPSSFPPVTLVIPRDPHVLALARELRLVWKTRLGIDVTVAQLNASNYNTVLGNRGFDLAIVRWGADYPDLQDFLGTQLGSSPDNVTGWTQRTYDRAVALADSYSPLDPRRVGLFRLAAGMALERLPIFPLDEPAFTAVFRPDLKGVALTPLGMITGSWAKVKLG